MKSNFIKYIFFIFVIVIMVFAIYKINQEEEIVEEPEEKIEEDDETIKEITLGIAEFDTMNPILSKNKYVQEISRIIYEPLLELDEQYKIKMCLVKDWAKTSEVTYLLRLRQDIKWSDGTPLTIEDVLYTIDILKRIPSVYAYNVQYVVRADKIDENTIQITLEHEIPFFEYNLIFPIMSKNYYADQDFETTAKNNMPIGTGKYKIEQNNNEGIILTKNENYDRGELSLEKITIGKYSNLGELYNAFKLGKVDLITTTNTGIQDSIGTMGYNIKENAGREYDFLALNTQSTVLSYKEIRQAISYAINKANLVAVINGKYRVSDYPLDYGNWLKGEPQQNGYDTNKAKEILEQNGWTLRGDRWQKTENYRTRTTSNIRLIVQSNNPTRVSVAEMIKSNLDEIGIKISIVKVNDTQYKNYLQNKNYDIIITGTTQSTSPNLETYFGATNLANYQNEEVNTIMNEVKNITKEELLSEKYTRLRQIYNDEVPYIGLYNSYYAVATSWTLRGNAEANWYNVFMDIDNWYKN